MILQMAVNVLLMANLIIDSRMQFLDRSLSSTKSDKCSEVTLWVTLEIHSSFPWMTFAEFSESKQNQTRKLTAEGQRLVSEGPNPLKTQIYKMVGAGGGVMMTNFQLLFLSWNLLPS